MSSTNGTLNYLIFLQNQCKCSSANNSLFLKHVKKFTTIILVYVDDIIFVGNNNAKIQHITNLLDINLHINNLRDITYFLSIEVARNNIGIYIFQRKYIVNLLLEIRMLECSPNITHVVHLTRSTITSSNLLIIENSSSYWRLIGHLIYLINTRSDIPFAVNHLSQFISTPNQSHQQAATCILRYLKRSPGIGLFFSASISHQIKAYNDSEWASCPITRKSSHVFLFTLRILLSLGNQRNNKPYQEVPLKLNIVLLPLKHIEIFNLHSSYLFQSPNSQHSYQTSTIVFLQNSSFQLRNERHLFPTWKS